MNWNYQLLGRVPGTQEITDLDSSNSQELTERRGSLGIDSVYCELPHQDIDAELPLYTRICRTLLGPTRRRCYRSYTFDYKLHAGTWSHGLICIISRSV